MDFDPWPDVAEGIFVRLVLQASVCHQPVAPPVNSTRCALCGRPQGPLSSCRALCCVMQHSKDMGMVARVHSASQADANRVVTGGVDSQVGCCTPVNGLLAEVQVVLFNAQKGKLAQKMVGHSKKALWPQEIVCFPCGDRLLLSSSIRTRTSFCRHRKMPLQKFGPAAEQTGPASALAVRLWERWGNSARGTTACTPFTSTVQKSRMSEFIHWASLELTLICLEESTRWVSLDALKKAHAAPAEIGTKRRRLAQGTSSRRPWTSPGQSTTLPPANACDTSRLG